MRGRDVFSILRRSVRRSQLSFFNVHSIGNTPSLQIIGTDEAYPVRSLCFCDVFLLHRCLLLEFCPEGIILCHIFAEVFKEKSLFVLLSRREDDA